MNENQKCLSRAQWKKNNDRENPRERNREGLVITLSEMKKTGGCVQRKCVNMQRYANEWQKEKSYLKRQQNSSCNPRLQSRDMKTLPPVQTTDSKGFHTPACRLLHFKCVIHTNTQIFAVVQQDTFLYLDQEMIWAVLMFTQKDFAELKMLHSTFMPLMLQSKNNSYFITHSSYLLSLCSNSSS